MKYEISIQPVNQSRIAEVDFGNIPFGRVFSDHMFISNYKDGKWQNHRIVPYAPIQMAPSNLTLHYGQTIFEGMKVSKDAEGNPLLFRVDKHAERFYNSAEGMAMTPVPHDLFEQAIRTLVALDHKWIPDTPGSNLYIRPFLFAADELLGVTPSESYNFIIFTCPVSYYYNKPLRLTVATDHVRAFKGGIGASKAAANYAASMYLFKKAKQQGFDQVIWTDGINHSQIQESGTMNLFFVIDGTVVTPALDGSILPGITRDSFIHILRHKGYKVEERTVTIQEIAAAAQNNTLQEAFGAGTAAVVAVVESIEYKGTTIQLPPTDNRPISFMLRQELNNIRTGITPDPFGWVEKLPVPIEI
jgi:branched-chain amino acid aminotransferase